MLAKRWTTRKKQFDLEAAWSQKARNSSFSFFCKIFVFTELASLASLILKHSTYAKHGNPKHHVNKNISVEILFENHFPLMGRRWQKSHEQDC